MNRAAEKGRGQLGRFALGPTLLMGPKRSIYPNRTVKYSIKAVSTYILPWPPQVLSAALKMNREEIIRRRRELYRLRRERETTDKSVALARVEQYQSKGFHAISKLTVKIFNILLL